MIAVVFDILAARLFKHLNIPAAFMLSSVKTVLFHVNRVKIGICDKLFIQRQTKVYYYLGRFIKAILKIDFYDTLSHTYLTVLEELDYILNL